jgi:DNA-binding winged helix-turn-helix (wHTH) protein/tetratricopeptide (TPR) repeat protein/TolB-like protein
MPHSVYRFGEYRVDPLARELHRGGGLLPLSPKVFDCLVYLIEHRDRAVGRDELIAAVWGKLDVSDTLLGQTLLKARRAVGDDGNEQNAIRTIPRFGYRWVGELVLEALPGDGGERVANPATVEPMPNREPEDTPAPAADATSIAVSPAPDTGARAPTRRRLRWFAAIAAAGLLVVVAIVWQQRVRNPSLVASGTSNPVLAEDSVVVLPAAIDSGEEWGWLRLGLMDLIATRLRRSGQAVVPSDNVVALVRAAGARALPNGEDIRSATGARYVVVPHVSRSGDAWQVQMELRSADGRTQEIQTQGKDPIETARMASNRLLALLGKSAPEDSDSASTLSLAELQQRTEAALLGDDFTTARRLIESAPPALRDTPLVRLRLAQIEFRTGRLDAARSSLEALLATVSAENDAILRARALYTLGAVAVREDRNADAVRAFGEAIALTETRNEPAVLGQAYTGLAAAQVNLGHHDDAANDLARARVALALAGDSLALARVDANEGVLDNARGRPAEALPILRRAAERFRRFGTLNDLALTIAAEVKAHIALLDPAAALVASDSLWSQRALLSNPRSRHALAFQHARALASNGRLTEARLLLGELDREVAADGQAGLPGDIASERARLALAAGDTAAAVDAALSAVAALPTVDEAHERARAWLTLCRALRAAGRERDAAEQLDRFTTWARTQSSMPSVTLFASLSEAEQAWATHHRDDAYRGFAAALADAERWAVPHDLASVVVSYGTSLISDNEVDRASVVVGRVARWAEQDYDSALLQVRLYRALRQTDAWRAALARVRTLAGERPVPAESEAPIDTAAHQGA